MDSGVNKEGVYGVRLGGLSLFDDYLKGTADSSLGAHSFAEEAPAAFFRFDNVDNVVNQHQGMAAAYAKTKPAPITPFLIYHWHFNHCH